MARRRLRGRAAELLRWLLEPTRIQAGSAFVAAVATVVLVGVTWRYVHLTHRLLQSQTEPQVVFEFDLGRREMVVANEGIDRIVNVAVRVDTVALAGPPENALLGTVQVSPEIPDRKARPWWPLETLEPGASVRKTIADEGANALKLMTMFEGQRSGEQVAGSPAPPRPQILGVLAFRLSFRREVDRRSYRVNRMVWVFHDSTDAKQPLFWNPDLGPTTFDKLLELVPPPRR
jgi:hypothetical protein